jgi:hypothetical protein
MEDCTVKEARLTKLTKFWVVMGLSSRSWIAMSPMEVWKRTMVPFACIRLLAQLNE